MPAKHVIKLLKKMVWLKGKLNDIRNLAVLRKNIIRNNHILL
jgi:hypothetical protein